MQKRIFCAESLSCWKPAHFTHVVHKDVWTWESRCQAGYTLLILISWEKDQEVFQTIFFRSSKTVGSLIVHSSDSKEAPNDCLFDEEI